MGGKHCGIGIHAMHVMCMAAAYRAESGELAVANPTGGDGGGGVPFGGREISAGNGDHEGQGDGRHAGGDSDKHAARHLR